ncbi:Na+/H+ antiporter NhaA [Pontibacter sp. HSC-14F20]|uniref:Na+/H+ antiporter NhaA n=1 Tax=Pontibacter sp. HSC-14F20 TaxID=2864136 RepID=UPI001C7318DD|nr:Na+/H+ antiporter NhaA [Pontibacter sp. HSC-14F20]MBX0334726.1 Na+/H+ antiporter NhaA [Pontibacter sp. HSC-14F20]
MTHRIVYSFESFEQVLVRGGTFTMMVALLALSWLNSPWGASWLYLWENPLTITLGTYSVSKPIGFWVQQVLLTLFYLTLGLELKRVLRVGELKEWPDRMFAVAAALGGMAIPAALYLYLVPAASQAGWSVVATADAAAVLALLALASNSLPFSLRVFLSSTAIVQGIATLLLSVLLYTSIQNLLALSVATGVFGLLVVLRALRNRTMWLYLLLGLVMLVCFLLAGVQGAVAGVLLALVIPIHARVLEEDFVTTTDTVMGQLHALRMMKRPEPGEEIEEDFQAAVHTLRVNSTKALSPLRRLQQRLSPWALYLALPLFALTYVPFAYNSFAWRELLGPVPLGIFVALVLGKPLGMLLIAWLASLSGIARIPASVHWGQLTGGTMLMGAGFMLSLFQAQQVFPLTEQLTLVKIILYAAAAVAGLLGILVLAIAGKTKDLPHTLV